MLQKIKNIAVVGAGTMGIGIAEVAASHGQSVKLYDVNFNFALGAKEAMAKRLDARVQRGKISEQQRQTILDNIDVVKDLTALATCQLIVEAIVENLSIKQELFKSLQSICAKDTLFASNTSSISITAIASVLDKPENMIGLHFFNPAPVMKLVEVIAGFRSSEKQLDLGSRLCHFWHKIPVIAQSSPGFIVNRVARPFYGEALKMLQEGVTKTECIDVLMQSAGFRMGPFSLMDLIGIDINLAVSKTVYASMYNDPRYRPSLIQEEMVAANMLGKKTGQGFYAYHDQKEKPDVAYEPRRTAAKYVSLNLDKQLLADIAKNIKASKHFVVTEHEAGACIQVGECAVLLSNGQTCDQRLQSLPYKHLAQLDLMLDYERCEIIHLAFDSGCDQQTREHIIGMFQLLHKKVMLAQDLPGLVVMRTVCMLINEAADAIENGVCSENDVDLAMQKGVNYPIGLLQWANVLGYAQVVEVLENLQQWFGDDRYRVSPWLRKKC